MGDKEFPHNKYLEWPPTMTVSHYPGAGGGTFSVGNSTFAYNDSVYSSAPPGLASADDVAQLREEMIAIQEKLFKIVQRFENHLNGMIDEG